MIPFVTQLWVALNFIGDAVIWGFRGIWAGFLNVMNKIVDAVEYLGGIATEYWRVVKLSVVTLLFWFWDIVFNLVLDLLCWSIELATSGIDAIPYDLSNAASYLVIPGQVVYVINIYVPLDIIMGMIAVYVTTFISVYVFRHVVKIAPFIG